MVAGGKEWWGRRRGVILPALAGALIDGADASSLLPRFPRPQPPSCSAACIHQRAPAPPFPSPPPPRPTSDSRPCLSPTAPAVRRPRWAWSRCVRDAPVDCRHALTADRHALPERGRGFQRMRARDGHPVTVVVTSPRSDSFSKPFPPTHGRVWASRCASVSPS